MALGCNVIPRTSVNQQPFSGSHYPFAEANEFTCAILDLHLSYKDDLCPKPPRLALAGQPSTPAQAGYRPSFYVSTLTGVDGVAAAWEDLMTDWEDWGDDWEAGIGSGEIDIPSIRIVIEDEDGQIVFDTDGIVPVFRAWGTDRFVILWTDEVIGCLQIVIRNSEPPADVSERLRLDARTYNRAPNQLMSLANRLGVTELIAGYNMRIDVEPLSVVDGQRRQTRIVFNAVPGAGEGRFSDCGEVVSPIRRIGGRTAGNDGNFILDADGCFRLQRPVTIFEDDDGRFAQYGDLDLSGEQAQHAIQISSDCGPRCPDSYYIRVHRGMLRMWDRWKQAAEAIEQVRDDYKTIKARWDLQRACRLGNPIKLVISPEKGCKFTIGGLLCNTTNVCLQAVEIRFQVEVLDHGTPIGATGSPCSQATIKGSFTEGQEAYDIGGTWPQYFANFPYASSQDSSSVRFRVCVPGCTSTQSLRVTMTVHGPDVIGAENYEPFDEDGSPYGSDYPIRYITTKIIPFNTLPPAFGCEC